MKKIILLTLISLAFLAGQCVAPVRSYFGLQTGINYSIFDPDDEAGNYSGVGFQIGLGMGIEIVNTIGLQMAPVFRTTSFNRTILNIETGANYKNLYLPFILQFKAGMVPVVSPYFGIGFAGNFQLDGDAYTGSIKSNIDDLESDLCVLLSLGTDIKLIKLKLTPEFTFNYNLTADDPDTQNRTEANYDFHLSVGIFYTP